MVVDVLTNFFGVWMGTPFGLRLTLLSGLGSQVIALTMLSFNQTEWTVFLTGPLVVHRAPATH